MPRLNVNRTEHLKTMGLGLRAGSHATEAHFAARAAVTQGGSWAARKMSAARAHQTAADRLGEENMRTYG